MMDGFIPDPNNTPPIQELSDTLRPAVERVRSIAPPPEAVERATDRAQRLGPPPRRRSRRWLLYTAASGIAAAILVGFGLWSGQLHRAPGELAWHKDLSQPAETEVGERGDHDLVQHDFSIGREVTSKDGTSNRTLSRERAASVEARTVNELFEQVDPKPSAADSSPARRADARTPILPAMRPEPPSPPEGSVSKPRSMSLENGIAGGRGRSYREDKSEVDRNASMARGGLAGPTPVYDYLQGQAKNGNGGIGGFPGQGPGQAPGQGGMMGMAGGMPGGPQKSATVSREDAIKTAQEYRDFHKKQLERYKELLSDEARLLEEQKNKLQEAEKLVKTLERDEKKSPPSQAEMLVRLREEVRTQEVALNKTIMGRANNAERAKKALHETKEDLRSLESRITQLKSQAGDKSRQNEPQVWHRDRSRPTFARVYVGDGNSLDLVSLHVSIIVEGPRARTVVDHIFRNPHNRQLEGTFEYPLPTGASPSYFAMFLGQTRNTVPALFGRRGDNAPLSPAVLDRMTPSELVKHVDTDVWGPLQEGRIVSKQKALETYEEVVRGRIDPALLEYAGGNTFSGRVFPIPPKGCNRVILAYEELLPVAQEQMIYRFSLPGRKLNEMQFRLQAPSADCLHPIFLPKDATKEERGGQITYNRTWKDSTPEGEVVFACTPSQPDIQAISGRQGDNGPRYAYARLRPALKTVANGKPFASHAVFLLDTSLSEHPDRFAVNMKLLQRILETDTDIKRFNILAFNVGAAWLDPKNFFENTAAGREKALSKLDGIVLEGATDISCALDKLAAPGLDLPEGTPLNVFLLSDGHITWGEPDVAALAARFEKQCPYPTRFHCYRTGLGEENSELFEALTRRGGGVFQCYGEAELAAAAKAHRSQCLQVKRVRFVGGPQASDILVSGRRAAVYPEGEIVVAARFNGTGRTTLILEGEFSGKEVVQEFPLEVRSESELAPRAWAEIAVASILALHDSNLDSLVTAYCQQFGIVSRVASFLVLENEADYKRFNLEEERGKTIADDLGNFLAETWSKLGKRVMASKEFERFLKEVDRRASLLNNPQSVHIKQLLAALTEEDFELPSGSIRGGLVYRKGVAGYLDDRERDLRNVAVYLTEARRRAESGDGDAAVRVLSSIIEEHPSRGDALRLVGYRLLDFQQPAQAARLFSQVQKQRPFEPHSFRDLAHALENSGRFGLAALNYEIVLAGNWHNRFRQELKLVAQEEYARMMQEAIRHRQVSASLANFFGERLEQMVRPQPKSDLRVTISWNTDATDIDLWVIEPDGTKCFYQHNRTQSGGELSQDQTQGYGPERYQIATAQPGVYTILVHYFGVNANLLGGETHVSVTVTRLAGTPQEKTERHTVILKQHNQQVEVSKVKF